MYSCFKVSLGEISGYLYNPMPDTRQTMSKPVKMQHARIPKIELGCSLYAVCVLTVKSRCRSEQAGSLSISRKTAVASSLVSWLWASCSNRANSGFFNCTVYRVPQQAYFNSLFLQPLKAATSNLVYNVSSGVRYNNSFSTKLGRGWLVYRSTSKIVRTKYHVPYITQ